MDIIGWIMVGISIIAVILSSVRRSKYCMILYMITSFWWGGYNWYIGETHQSVLRIFYFFMSVYGFYSWNVKEKIELDKDKYITELENKLENKLQQSTDCCK